MKGSVDTMKMSSEAYKKIKEELAFKEIPFKEKAYAFAVSDLINFASKNDRKFLESEIKSELKQREIKTNGAFSLGRCEFRRNISDCGIYNVPNKTVYDVCVKHCSFMLPGCATIRIDSDYGVGYKKMNNKGESFTCTHAYNGDIEANFFAQDGRKLGLRYGQNGIVYENNEMRYFKGDNGRFSLLLYFKKPQVSFSFELRDGKVDGYVSFGFDAEEKIHVQSSEVSTKKLNGKPRNADEIKEFYDRVQKILDIIRKDHGSSYWFTITERFTNLCFEALASEDKTFNQDKMVLPEIDLLGKDIRNKIQSVKGDIKVSYFKDKLDYLDENLLNKNKDVVLHLE